MSAIFTFKLSTIPPPKKNRYRIGKKRLFHDKTVQREIDYCTNAIKEQWGGRGPILDPFMVETLIVKPVSRPDDVNILETIYDCLESAGVCLNDKQIRAGNFFSIVTKEESELVIFSLSTINWEELWAKKAELQKQFGIYPTKSLFSGS